MNRVTLQNELRKIKLVAYDLDGVIYFGNKLLPNVVETIDELKDQNKEIVFITNNSAKSRVEICAKLESLGLSVNVHQIYSSSFLTGIFLKNLVHNKPVNVFVLGTNGLKKELANCQIGVVEMDEHPQFLIVGYDPDFNYSSICNGLTILQQGVKFIACNKEARYPVSSDKWLPGCGAMVAAIEISSGKEADFIIGKPNTLMLELIVKERNLKPEQILVVGDTPESDILMANNFGSYSALFIPGAEFGDSLPNLKSGFRPTVVIKDHRELITLLKKN